MDSGFQFEKGEINSCPEFVEIVLYLLLKSTKRHGQSSTPTHIFWPQSEFASDETLVRRTCAEHTPQQQLQRRKQGTPIFKYRHTSTRATVVCMSHPQPSSPVCAVNSQNFQQLTMTKDNCWRVIFACCLVYNDYEIIPHYWNKFQVWICGKMWMKLKFDGVRLCLSSPKALWRALRMLIWEHGLIG